MKIVNLPSAICHPYSIFNDQLGRFYPNVGIYDCVIICCAPSHCGKRDTGSSSYGTSPLQLQADGPKSLLHSITHASERPTPDGDAIANWKACLALPTSLLKPYQLLSLYWQLAEKHLLSRGKGQKQHATVTDPFSCPVTLA